MQPSDELKKHLLGISKLRASAVIFPVGGSRSLPDEMSGGDLDGDEFVVIWNDKIVSAFPSTAHDAFNAVEERELFRPASRLSRSATRVATKSIPAREECRDEAAAWHCARVRSCLGIKGRLANQWLLVAETKGAADKLAKILCYRYMAALDAAKMGSGDTAIPRECQLQHYPRHLQSHFKKSKAYPPESFTVERSTALSRLQSLDTPRSTTAVNSGEPLCMFPDDYRHDHARCAPYLEKWENLYQEYRDATRALPDFNDPEVKNSSINQLRAITEEFRSKLLVNRTDEQIKTPEHFDRELLIEAAAVYAVNHKRYYDSLKEARGYKPPSLGFSWNVAGDYFLKIKKLFTAERSHRGRRPGAAPEHDQRVLNKLVAAPRKR